MSTRSSEGTSDPHGVGVIPPPLLVRAIETLASVCDGAHSTDGAGFSAQDSGFGKRLALVPAEAWGPTVTRKAWEVTRKYSAQLSRLGIAWSDIPEPARAAGGDVRAVDYIEGRFIIRFGWEPQLVTAVKTIHGVRWNSVDKVWTAPIRSAAEVAAWSDRHNFLLTFSARAAFAAPEAIPSAPVGMAGCDADGIRLDFEYDAGLVTAVRHLIGRKWDADNRCWRFPPTSVREVRAFVAAHEFGTSHEFDALPDIEPDFSPSVEVMNERFIIRFPYDRDLIQRARDLPSARWSKTLWGWTVDIEAAIEVAEFIEATEGLIGESAVQALADARDALDRISGSSAEDAELEIHGLGGTLMPFQRAGVAYIIRSLGITYPRQEEHEEQG